MCQGAPWEHRVGSTFPAQVQECSFQGDDIGQKAKFKAMARTLTGQSQVQQYTNQNVLLRSGPKVVC